MIQYIIIVSLHSFWHITIHLWAFLRFNIDSEVIVYIMHRKQYEKQRIQYLVVYTGCGGGFEATPPKY